MSEQTSASFSTTVNDMVNHPQHYKTGKIECIDCISAIVNMYDGEQAYDVGQVIKYLYRAPTKLYARLEESSMVFE